MQSFYFLNLKFDFLWLYSPVFDGPCRKYPKTAFLSTRFKSPRKNVLDVGLYFGPLTDLDRPIAILEGISYAVQSDEEAVDRTIDNFWPYSWFVTVCKSYKILYETNGLRVYFL